MYCWDRLEEKYFVTDNEGMAEYFLQAEQVGLSISTETVKVGLSISTETMKAGLSISTETV